MVVAVTVFAFLAFIYIARRIGDELYLKLGLIALLGHVVVSVGVVPNIPYVWDFGQFDRAAQQVATGTLPSGSTVASFAAVQGVVYAIFGHNETNIAIVSGLLAVLVPIPIRYITTELYDHVSLDTVTALVLFLPLPFLMLSLPMRDSTSVFVFFSLLALALRAIQRNNGALGILTVPLWGMLYLVRPELALVSLLAILATISIKVIETFELEPSLRSLIVVLGAVGAIGFSLFAELLYSFDRVNAALSYRASGGAVYLDGMQYNSWFDFLLIAPGRAVYFQFTPFPLHIESIFHLLTFSGTVIAMILFVSALRSLYECDYDRTTAVLLIVVYLAGTAGYGAINSNFGTGVRHRIVFDFILIMTAAPVIARWELLVREWLGVVPRHRGEHDEQQRETQELNRHVKARGEYPNDTGE
ncbi:hypothetical protein DQW50_12765 [Halorubrum sp. 48-1-W]|uniref:glycosyltransferase family 39 protein n=1 Tax=Halorubrum sp. 48-1-W TaxID=2249761 RepID=UPI000DCD0FA3|nr:glycosyltransferase family 39 protein [Halorubrum sp. 48-1-W]RAW44718.1 hypothetical protein DQW50_12765 [Halorubrum sp. 48-1-W]